MSKKRGVYELKKNELGPGPCPANDWTGCGGPGPGPEKMPRTWPGPDFGQSSCHRPVVPIVLIILIAVPHCRQPILSSSFITWQS